MPAGELDAIWTPMHLERLARTYWKYLSRVTLGLIRVEYTDTERAVVLLHRPFVLLRFHAPEYEMSDGRGIVRWRSATASSSRARGARATATWRSTSGAARPTRPGYEQRARRGRDRELLPGARDLGGALVLRQHAVAHPRARHARLPALARAAASSRSRPSGASPPEHGDAPAPARRRAAASTSATRRGSRGPRIAAGRRRRRLPAACASALHRPPALSRSGSR